MVASDTAHGHTLAWLARHTGDADCTVTDVTADYGQLNVQGPRSREVLAGLTDADLSTEAFGFRTARWLELAGVEVLCVRITYLGELGYELYVPAADTLRVYDALQAAGAAYGLRPVGLKALASLRMEKGYRDFGHDIDNTDCPLEAGLGFALALDKPGGFVGRDAVLARKAANAAAGGMGQRIVQVRVLDPEPLLFHAEVLHRDGEAVGYVRAASYGWTLGGAVGLAMVSGGGEPVTPDWLQGRHLGGRHRRRPAPGRGVAAADVRPDLGTDQGLTGLYSSRSPSTCIAASSALAPAPSMPTSYARGAWSSSSYMPSSGATRRPARGSGSMSSGHSAFSSYSSRPEVSGSSCSSRWSRVSPACSSVAVKPYRWLAGSRSGGEYPSSRTSLTPRSTRVSSDWSWSSSSTESLPYISDMTAPFVRAAAACVAFPAKRTEFA